MRTIKFRGQRVDNGEWVYGAFYPIKGEDVCFIINNCQSLYFDDNDTVFEGHKVHRESVGQFTGLHDKNGKEIYEGDVINVPYNLIGNIKVVFEKGIYNISKYNISLVEIVGNIHTTPELLNPLKK